MSSAARATSIFIPAVGYGNGTSLEYSGDGGAGWSSVLVKSSDRAAYNAYHFIFGWADKDEYVHDNARDYGITVRPVKDAKPPVEFGSAECQVNEGEKVDVVVNGGSEDGASSVKVYLSCNSAAAADLDLAKGAVDGVTPKGGLKFPLTLSWDAGQAAV